jgi:hypothetical protein
LENIWWYRQDKNVKKRRSKNLKVGKKREEGEKERK